MGESPPRACQYRLMEGVSPKRPYRLVKEGSRALANMDMHADDMIYRPYKIRW